MKTLFYSDYRYSMVRAAIGLALGLFLMLNPVSAIYTSIWILAAFLLAIGGISIYYMFQQKESGEYAVLAGINGAVSFLLGLFMIIFPKFFVGIFIYILAAVLLLASLGQLISLVQLRRRILVPLYLFIPPGLLLILSILLLFKPFESAQTLYILFGILFIIYAIAEAWQAYQFSRLKKG